jgi:hypothetical protein
MVILRTLCGLKKITPDVPNTTATDELGMAAVSGNVVPRACSLTPVSWCRTVPGGRGTDLTVAVKTWLTVATMLNPWIRPPLT